ncbi:MAG: HAMP domain-containing sensor histidine kinase [Chloroflexota bacterium]
MAPVTACVHPVFHNARLKLTLAYTTAIALVMVAFSLALYTALKGSLAGNLELGNNATAQVEQAVLAAEFHRARLVLLAINAVGWAIAAAVSYVIAGRTLRPIEDSLSRQREFTAHASHELRTPLTIVKGEIDVTLAQERPPEEYRRVLTLIEEEVDHLEKMVADLLTLARIEAAPRMLEREQRGVGEVIHETAELFTPQLSERDVQVEINVPPGLRARLDWARVRHLLANLMDNAARYTPPHGHIDIRAADYGKGLELRVFNTGSHIAESDLPHLFTPFYRGKASSSESGTGLGLALCDWITRAHGGSIAAHNEHDGVAFVVRLPRG